MYDSLARIRKTMKSLEVSLGRDPSHAEIAEEMNNATDKGIRFTAEKVRPHQKNIPLTGPVRLRGRAGTREPP